MRRSLVDTITSRIHTSAALSDGPRDDPRRLETVRAPPRQASLLSLCDHIAARIIAVQKRDPRDTRKRDQDDRGTRSTFRQIDSLEKESDQKHAPGQSPRPPPRRRRTTWWFKDDKLTTALPLALARFAKETRRMERPPYNCAVRTGFK